MEDKPIVILVAEDNESNYFLVKEILSEKYQLIHAIDGEQAFKLFIEHNPDLVLMDIKMPVMDGFQAVKQIREISDVPVIALTAYAFDEDKHKIMASGFNDYMSKPLRPEALNNIVLKTLDMYKNKK